MPWVGYAQVKVALVANNVGTNSAQYLKGFLEAKDFDLTILELNSESEFPAQKIFEHLNGIVVRLIESDQHDSALNVQEAEFWTDFLTSHGSLIIMADQLGAPEIWSSALPSYVGFGGSQSAISGGILKGSANDLISDKIVIGTKLDGQRDILQPLDGSGVDPVLYTPAGQVLGVKQQSCAFRMSYFSFLPDEIIEPSDRSLLYERIIDWHLGYAIGEGTQAPEFPVITLSGETAGIYNVWADQPDSIIVLEFFATWCSSCEVQLPRMVALRNKFRDKNVFFHFVSYKEPLTTVKEYLDTHPEIDWTVSTTINGLGAKKYGVKRLPGIYILDTQRKIREIHQGTVSEEILEREIKQVLAFQNG